MTQETQNDDPGWYSEQTATFGDRLVAARSALGMSQKNLALRIGVRVTTLNKWEEDLSEPRANRLNTLSGVLNVSMRWLLTGIGDGPADPMPDEISDMSVDLTALLTDLRQTQSELQRSANRLALIEKRLKKAIGSAQ